MLWSNFGQGYGKMQNNRPSVQFIRPTIVSLAFVYCVVIRIRVYVWSMLIMVPIITIFLLMDLTF